MSKLQQGWQKVAAKDVAMFRERRKLPTTNMPIART